MRGGSEDGLVVTVYSEACACGYQTPRVIADSPEAAASLFRVLDYHRRRDGCRAVLSSPSR